MSDTVTQLGAFQVCKKVLILRLMQLALKRYLEDGGDADDDVRVSIVVEYDNAPIRGSAQSQTVSLDDFDLAEEAYSHDLLNELRPGDDEDADTTGEPKGELAKNN